MRSYCWDQGPRPTAHRPRNLENGSKMEIGMQVRPALCCCVVLVFVLVRNLINCVGCGKVVVGCCGDGGIWDKCLFMLMALGSWCSGARRGGMGGGVGRRQAHFCDPGSPKQARVPSDTRTSSLDTIPLFLDRFRDAWAFFGAVYCRVGAGATQNTEHSTSRASGH